MTNTSARGRYYPDMPPPLEGEDSDAYTDRLTGADRTDRSPYDHVRYRQCSIGFHEQCSDPEGGGCGCPCHTTISPARRHDDPRAFGLIRDVDETGISGTGMVARGVQFGDGTCVMRWDTGLTSTAIYDDLADLVAIHGHGGKTRVVWIEQGGPNA
jgi:hypothetical protein